MLGNHGRGVMRAVFQAPARALAKAGVTPNAVTITGTLTTIAAAAGLLATGYLKSGALVVTLVLFADSLDGNLARLSGQESKFGAFLDSCLDRIGDGAVFGSLLFWVVSGMPPSAARTAGIIGGICAIIGAAAVPYVRAKGESVGVVAKVGIAERTDRLTVGLLGALLTGFGLSAWFLSGALIIVAVASFITVIQRLDYVRRNLD